MKRTHMYLLAMLLLMSNCQVEHQPKNLVLIAGPNDHCKDNPCHMYIEDMQAMKQYLENDDNGNFAVRLYIHERPPLGSLDSVDAVIIHSSADRLISEWHALFPQNDDTTGYNEEYMKFLNDFQRQVDRGMGLMMLHYSVWVDHPEARKRYLDWFGGYYEEGYSQVDGDRDTPGTTAVETVTFPNPDHPILNGVNPWTTDAEYYFNMVFQENRENITPILNSMLPLNDPAEHTVAWAKVRDNGGRSFAFTGGHFHKNFELGDYRKMMMNAVLWISKEVVPGNGFESLSGE